MKQAAAGRLAGVFGEQGAGGMKRLLAGFTRAPRPEEAPPAGAGLLTGPLLCVVDPGSHVLRVAVVDVGRNGATVVGWGNERAADDAPALRGALETSLARAEEMAKGRVPNWRPTDQMVVGLPAWQVRGWAWPMSQRREHPDRPIDERELETLMARALRLAVNRLGGPEVARQGRPRARRTRAPAGAGRDTGPHGWVLMEAVPVALTVDGHGTTDPIGFRGRELGVSLFAALVRRETVAWWTQTAESMGFGTLTLTAASMALAACAPDAQGLIVDVGGHSTGFGWARSGRPVAVHTLAMGGEMATDQCLRHWGISWDKAEALKRAYSAGRLTAEAGVQVQRVIAPAVEAWLAGVEGVLTDMSEHTHGLGLERSDGLLPHRFHVCGGGSGLKEVGDALQSLVWSRRLKFDRYPQFDPLTPAEVPGVVNLTEEGRGAGDVALLAVASWTARAGGTEQREDRPLGILRELCGI